MYLGFKIILVRCVLYITPLLDYLSLKENKLLKRSFSQLSTYSVTYFYFSF